MFFFYGKVTGWNEFVVAKVLRLVKFSKFCDLFHSWSLKYLGKARRRTKLIVSTCPLDITVISSIVTEH